LLQKKKIEVILLVILLLSAIANGELLPSKSLSLQEIHLVRCLTYVSHKYFAPGRSLLISAPTTYRDVQQELIAEVQRNSIWPVVVTVDGSISKANKTDLINRDGSYIVLIPNGDINHLKAEINGIAFGRAQHTKIWNSEARFVVAGANEFSMPHKVDILHFFSKLRIYNCMIVSQEHNVIDKEYSRPIKFNDVDTGMNLAVYT
jgi:hypothetical protein